MNTDHLDSEVPDRLYTVTGGRGDPGGPGDPALDSVTLLVAESEPAPHMQSEHADILRLCTRPTAVVEISAELGLPVSVVRILLVDLLDTGAVVARHPVPSTPQEGPRHDPDTLKQVLLALQRL
ncbi:hypothetical protein GCM10007079_38260 [Nocardiopsis terrae]|uniref:DUF742 domain-containing protein n=1 Tax=Nocardiopsis terrae TaxID=372655 RepID=A0ABR9HDV4_9ACTN|nr:DUF742 domain-containing protein [Nocardiopsis terrae]MBE1457213.1 hypothetical protein [Nocardiopsis terrae]GHC91178.1 hypothetical protein GCM10007079_38260 [Nocardiopsis terrae]